MLRKLTKTLVPALFAVPAVASALPSVQGGADRQHFTVSGHLTKSAGGALAGRFMIVVRPDVPDSSTLAVVCTYTGFTNFTVVGNQTRFDARGACTTLDDEGTLPSWSAANRFTITDNGAGPDLLDVNMYGANGIAIPGGAVSFGDFTVTP